MLPDGHGSPIPASEEELTAQLRSELANRQTVRWLRNSADRAGAIRADALFSHHAECMSPEAEQHMLLGLAALETAEHHLKLAALLKERNR